MKTIFTRRRFLLALLTSLTLISQTISAQLVDYPLDEALDSGLTFTTSDTYPFVGDSSVTHDGVDSAMVIAGGDGTAGYAWIQTVVSGPARVSFWWLYDSMYFRDSFTVYLDGSRLLNPATKSVWNSNYVDVPTGTHTIRWEARKVLADYFQLLAVLDEVTVTSMADQVPTVTIEPASPKVPLGKPLTLHANATGDSVQYRWVRQSNPFHNLGIEPDLQIAAMSRKDADTYTVTVSNAFGTAQTNAVITVDYDTLADALDTTNLQWRTSGTGDWFAQTSVTHDGMDAVQSPVIGSPSMPGYAGPSQLQAVIMGPASVSCYVKISGSVFFDETFHMTVDGQPDGLTFVWNTDWYYDSVNVPFGEHVVSFEHSGSSTAWVDEVTVTPLTGDAPILGSQSSDMTVTAGNTVSLKAEIVNDLYVFPTWIWFLNGTNIATTTSNSLQFAAVPQDAGTYTVVISNFFGAVTSAPIQLTVKPSSISLRTALDDPNLVWNVDPATPWFGQSHFKHDRRSAGMGNGTLQTTVIGPGVLSFWWMCLGSNLDLVETISDPRRIATCPPTGEWQKLSVSLGIGPHVLQWSGSGVGCLDEVHFTPGTQEPLQIVQQPMSYQMDSTETSGHTFTVGVKGPQPLTYQWWFNGNPVGESQPSLYVMPSYYDGLGYYSVTVSSPAGTVQSELAFLSIKSPTSATLGEPGLQWWRSEAIEEFDEGGWLVASDAKFGQGKVLQTTGTLDLGATFLQNTVIGPGTLSFWWKVSSETNADFFRFSIDYTAQADISGETKWQHYTCHVDGGQHVVEWDYVKDAGSSAGRDCGWIADVQFTPDAALDVTPKVHIVPHEETVYEGSTAIFNTICRGPKPTSYEWSGNNEGPKPDQLVLPVVIREQAGTYTVTASTELGSGSDFALLNVQPAITGKRVMAGSDFNLKFNYAGPKLDPFNWANWGGTLTDGGRVRGSTTPVLRISHAQVDDTGEYGLSLQVPDSYALNVSASVLVLPRAALVGWGFDYSYTGDVTGPSDITDAVAVATEMNRSAAVLADGTVRVWPNYSLESFFVPDDLTDVVSVALANDGTVALKRDGSVVTWPIYDDVPFPPGPSGQTTRAISASEFHVLYLDQNGTVTASGDNSFGQCGVPADLKDVTAVAAGNGYSLAVLKSGRIVAWGDNNNGLLMVPHVRDAIAVAAGDQHALALRRNGTVVAWGNNLDGRTSVPRGLTNVVAIAAGAKHSVALTRGGRVVSWGGEYSWDQGVSSASVPVGLKNVARIAASGGHTFALKFAPDIVSQPMAQTEDDPSFSTITVQACGRSPLSYAWRLNGKIIGTSPTLRVRTPANSSAASRQKFDVVVRNRYGSAVSEQITLAPLDGGYSGFVSGLDPIWPGSGLMEVINRMPTSPMIPLPPLLVVTSGIGASSGINISKQNDSIVLSWMASNAVLECTDSIDGNFTTNVGAVQVSAGSKTSVTIPVSSQQKFYRLRRP